MSKPSLRCFRNNRYVHNCFCHPNLTDFGSDPPRRGPGARVHAARRPTTARAGHLDRLPGENDHPDSVDFLADLTTFINVTVSTVLIILLQSKSRMAADSQRTRERRELEVSDAARQPKNSILTFDTFLSSFHIFVGAGVCAPCPSRPKDGGGEFPVQTRATGLVLINIFYVTNLCLSLSHCV